MRGFRAGSVACTSIVLLWQLAVIIVMPGALCCGAAASSSSGSSHDMVADCPMREQTAGDASCPLHKAQSGTHECDCPTLACSQTDQGFMAVFGPIGVLPAPSLLGHLDAVSRTPLIENESAAGLAPVPLAPPPRT